MIEIVDITELKPGDLILIEGMEDNDVNLVTVEKVTEDGLIIPEELGGLDYTPSNPGQIIRLGTEQDVPNLIINASIVNVFRWRMEAPQKCIKCGCTNNSACDDPETGTCWWVTEQLCSMCATPEQKQQAIEEMKALDGQEEKS